MYGDMIPFLAAAIFASLILKIISIAHLYNQEKRLKVRRAMEESRNRFREYSAKRDLSLSGPSALHILSYVDSLIKFEDEVIVVDMPSTAPSPLTQKAYPSSPPILTQRVDIHSTLIPKQQEKGYTKLIGEPA